MYIYLGLFASVLGLGVAHHIYSKKISNTKLVCPRNGCDHVVHSAHAKTVGIPNEVLGIAYYVIVGVLYAVLFAIPRLDVLIIHRTISILTWVGIVFSSYLIFLQAFVIRQWCHLCLLSAFATVLLGITLFL